MRGQNLACGWFGLGALVAASGCGADPSSEQNAEIEERAQALSCAAAPWLSTHFGDVVIHNQAEADAIDCVTRITGSLTIADSDAFAIALPNLRSVFGDVSIVYSSDTGPSPCTGCELRTVSLPQLSRIVGDVTLTYPGANGGFYGAFQHLGLDALTTLIGDLNVEIDNFGANLSGLAALTRLDGSLSVWVQTGDVSGGSFLPQLRLVTGDVHFLDGGNTFNLMNSLETVLGTFAVNDLLLITSAHNFEALRTVGHNVELRNTHIMGPADGSRLFPELSLIGGYLDVQGTRIDSTIENFVIARADMRLFGLRLVDTDFVSFAGFDPRLFPFGQIDLRDNTLLCADAASDFVTAQRAQGFFGLAAQSGNGADATCP